MKSHPHYFAAVLKTLALGAMLAITGAAAVMVVATGAFAQ